MTELAPPRVAVLTRTKDRTVMLRRALASVRGQTLPRESLRWCILNDGGDPAPVDAVADEARGAGIDVRVRHEPVNIGLIKGLVAVVGMDDSPYFAVHDDDDSWEPAFLEKTAAYLDAHPGAGAVATHATYIEEAINDDQSVAEVKRGAFNASLAAYSLADMAQKNASPPISILLRRATVEAVGGFSEWIPAMEDWDLMLRILVRADIGVIPEALANYHVRIAQSGAAANTIHAGWRMHAEAEALIRNHYLREDLAAGRAGLGFLLAMGGMTKGNEELRRFTVAHNRLKGLWPYRMLRKLLGGGK